MPRIGISDLRFEIPVRGTGVVGEHSVSRRRCLVRDAGDIGRAYADMSNDNAGERPARRKPKVSWVKVIFPGLVGP